MFLFHDKSSFSKQFCFFVLFLKQKYLYFCLPNHSVTHSSLARRNWQGNYVTQLCMTWLSSRCPIKQRMELPVPCRSPGSELQIAMNIEEVPGNFSVVRAGWKAQGR